MTFRQQHPTKPRTWWTRRRALARYDLAIARRQHLDLLEDRAGSEREVIVIGRAQVRVECIAEYWRTLVLKLP